MRSFGEMATLGSSHSPRRMCTTSPAPIACSPVGVAITSLPVRSIALALPVTDSPLGRSARTTRPSVLQAEVYAVHKALVVGARDESGAHSTSGEYGASTSPSRLSRLVSLPDLFRRKRLCPLTKTIQRPSGDSPCPRAGFAATAGDDSVAGCASCSDPAQARRHRPKSLAQVFRYGIWSGKFRTYTIFIESGIS